MSGARHYISSKNGTMECLALFKKNETMDCLSPIGYYNLMRDYFKNDYQKYTLIIGMSFLISLAFTSPLVTGLTNDKEIFRYIAMTVSKGFIPYVDTTEMRPPVIFFLGAPFAGSEWSFWFLFSTVTAIAGIAFYKIALSLGTKYPYLCTAIYFLLLE